MHTNRIRIIPGDNIQFLYLLSELIGVKGDLKELCWNGMQSRGKFIGLTTIRGGGAIGDIKVLPPSPEDVISRDSSVFLLNSLLSNSILQ